jgi:ATP-dependent helicase IRC3
MALEFPEIDYSIFSHRKTNNEEVIISSIQSASKPTSLKKLNEKEFELLIIDECHRSCAKSYRKLIHCLGFDRKKIIGFTATPFRTDMQSLTEIFGFPSFKMNIIDLIKEGFLVDLVGYRIKTNITLTGISTKGGDFIEAKLGAVINVSNRNKLILDSYKKNCAGKKALVFCASINHAVDLCNEFNSEKIPSAVIHGKMKTSERSKVLKKFKEGEIRVITNCNILTEGFDEPSIECLLMARPTLSKTLYIQMIGRGLRLYPNKKNCTVIEFTDNYHDVCDLEDLIDIPKGNSKSKDGEPLSAYFERAKKGFIGEGNGAIEQEMNLIKSRPLSYSERPATIWQIKELKNKFIKFSEPISEAAANLLLTRSQNGHNRT